MINRLFNSTAFRALELGLDASSIRAHLISNNIANADTPNFKAQRLRFEEVLARRLGVDCPGGELPLRRTDPRHLPGRRTSPLDSIQTPVGDIYTDRSYTHRLDGNNVDIDQESAEQAKNALHYSILIELANRRLGSLRTVISGGRK